MEHPKKLRTFADEYSTVGVSAAFFLDVSQQSKTGHGSGHRTVIQQSDHKKERNGAHCSGTILSFIEIKESWCPSGKHDAHMGIVPLE